MINKDGVPRQHMSYYGFPRVVSNEHQKAKWLKRRQSIPAESKRAENMLEPADEGS